MFTNHKKSFNMVKGENPINIYIVYYYVGGTK